MIVFPEKCLRKSVSVHNIDTHIFCDWIEGGIRFECDEISKSDVIDILLENNIYLDQDYAAEFVENVWRELRRRLQVVGDNCRPFDFFHNRIRKVGEWQDFSGYSFCLILSFSTWYSDWANQFGDDYTDQGLIFEELTKESLIALLPEWEVFQTGWSKENPVTIQEVIKDVADRVGSSQGNVTNWVSPAAKDLGLDLVCHRPFLDERLGQPVFLIQCASGHNWDTKLHTPDQNVWDTIINWPSKPKKGFSTPYSLSTDLFNQSCLRVNGLLLDRYRLLSAGHRNADWISGPLRDRIVDWVSPRATAVATQLVQAAA